MARQRTNPITVSLVAIPDALISALSGIFDVPNSFRMLRGQLGVPDAPPYRVEIVGESADTVRLASGLPLTPGRAVTDVEASDIVIVPSVILDDSGRWLSGRYPALVDWIGRMHRQGASICSACSGIFLIAETGLMDGCEATVHWPYARAFRAGFPDVGIEPERALVVSGARGEFVSSGASTSWHDLVLYLIARDVGPPAAQTVARFFALQRHVDGLAPFMVFDPPTDHGDAAVAAAQHWLAEHASVAAPVAEAAARAEMSDRTFSRRFRRATGHAPLAYVQRLRMEEAKRRLERTNATVEEIAWRTGYEDPAAFRRLFRRIVGMAPGRYRRAFAIPLALATEPSLHRDKPT